ncbi:MAG: hypothetical protein D3924_00225 [Candidatus Electrothrix sp. AR4]|nr:hypothetical protein [Candidatus Electrothrix sp. AR4]
MHQASITIVYPIEGGAYPIIESDSLASAACFTASFSITSAGGPHKVKWGFDGMAIGGATFFDQFSNQFTWNLPAGEHVFHIASSLDSKAKVTFEIA